MSYWVIDTGDKKGIVVLNTDGGGTAHFSGLSNKTIKQGNDFDLLDGVKAFDENGNEIPFSVSPNEVDKCEVGVQEFTYTAKGLKAVRKITVEHIANPTISGLTELTVTVNEEFDPLVGVSAVDGNGNVIAVTVEE